MFIYRDKQQLLTIYIYSMIAACLLEYMLITVTCCEEIAKKLFKHFLQLLTHDVPYIQVIAVYFGVCICVIASATRITAQQIPELSMTLHLDFQDFPGRGNFTNTILGLSRRRGNPEKNLS